MAPGCMRLVLLAATFQTTAAALALPSVLTTHGHNATAYVVAAAPGGCGAAPHLRVACGKPRRVFAEELPAAVLITRCAFSKASCRCPDGGHCLCARTSLARYSTENPRPRKSARRFRHWRKWRESCGAFWGRLTPKRCMPRKSWGFIARNLAWKACNKHT